VHVSRLKREIQPSLQDEAQARTVLVTEPLTVDTVLVQYSPEEQDKV